MDFLWYFFSGAFLVTLPLLSRWSALKTSTDMTDGQSVALVTALAWGCGFAVHQMCRECFTPRYQHTRIHNTVVGLVADTLKVTEKVAAHLWRFHMFYEARDSFRDHDRKLWHYFWVNKSISFAIWVGVALWIVVSNLPGSTSTPIQWLLVVCFGMLMCLLEARVLALIDDINHDEIMYFIDNKVNIVNMWNRIHTSEHAELLK